MGPTCFDSTESSSGPRVLDLYRECTTHCGGSPTLTVSKIKYKNIDYNTDYM